MSAVTGATFRRRRSSINARVRTPASVIESGWCRCLNHDLATAISYLMNAEPSRKRENTKGIHQQK